MGIGVWTIIVFNIERILVISRPLHQTWLCKKWSRRNRYTIIVVTLSLAFSAAIISKISVFYRNCDFDTNIKFNVLMLVFDVTGTLYVFGPTIVLPCLSITLVYQIRKVMQNSKKIRSENQTNATATIQNVRLHLGQILIASYTFICLFPNVIYFLRFQGKFICLI